MRRNIMFWTEEKLAARIRELEKYRYRDAIPITDFYCQPDTGEVGARPPKDGNWQRMSLGDRWKGRDTYLWLAADVKVPAEWRGRTVLGRFDFGRTGGGNNSGFESLLFLNGEPYQGVDQNHQEVFLPESAVGSTVELRFRLWSGLEGGGAPTEQEHQLKIAELAWLDEATDDLFYTGKAVLETVKLMEENQPERIQLLTALDRAFHRLDWSEPGSDAFYQSVADARETLRSGLDSLEKHHPVTVRCIGHTHIDVAWLWRLRHTREKAARSFATVLRLMEKYPEYVFIQSQPQLYDYLKGDYPELYEQIRKRVKEGRWEAGGAMWLEADCNIPSGESLVRQILMGTRFLRKEFGVECTYLWLPDVFGYNWALPQILKKSGIDTFMTTKISWNQYNRLPHDTFKWRGIDGSEVLVHFITTPDEHSENWFYTYNGQITPGTVKGIWDAYQDKKINRELLLSYGYGDGGGGVNREMLEMRRRLNEVPGLPKVVTGRADEFFKRLHERVAKTDQYVHTWDGELYLEYHRGTYTSQAYNKRMNRKLELLYREAEWLGVLAGLSSDWSSYPQNQLNDGWKILLRNQFHDIIPGSSIREVYEDSRREYEKAQHIGETVWNRSVEKITTDSSSVSYTVFNSAPWERTELVQIPAETAARPGRWFDDAGRECEVQPSENSWWVQVTVPPMGYTTLHFEEVQGSEERQDPSYPFNIRSSGIETPYYDIEWNDSGQLTRLYDREAERDVLAEGARGNVFQIFEDKPLRFDAWDIDLFYQEKMREVVDLRSVKVKEVGPLRAVIRFEWSFKNSTIEQEMILYSNCRRIDFQTEVDWQERQQLMKVAFPVNIRATEATYDIQFGNVKRPTHWNTSWDWARFETVGHQWADLSERGYGVSLLNDCKYGYDIKNNVMRLSLLKSAIYPDVEADRGRHAFTYALYPHIGDWVEGDTVIKAWSLNSPLRFVQGKPLSPKFSLLRLSVPHVMIDAVKKAEDDNRVIVRVHEFTGRRGPVEIRSDLSVQSWRETDLMERPIGESSTEEVIRFNIRPYEIKTFAIDFK